MLSYLNDTRVILLLEIIVNYIFILVSKVNFVCDSNSSSKNIVTLIAQLAVCTDASRTQVNYTVNYTFNSNLIYKQFVSRILI